MDSLQQYIEHPQDIPIELSPVDANFTLPGTSSALGLICNSFDHIPPGRMIRIDIPELQAAMTGQVDWCIPGYDAYQLGISFADPESANQMRMLEQICYIQSYQHRLQTYEGRHLSLDAAAREWISKYAAYFPTNTV